MGESKPLVKPREAPKCQYSLNRRPTPALTLYQFSQDDSDVLRDEENAPRPLLRLRETQRQGFIRFGSPISFYPWISFYSNYDLVSEGIQAEI